LLHIEPAHQKTQKRNRVIINLKRLGLNCVIFQTNSGEFDWDSRQQGLILGSFSFGYVATQLIGGILAEMYGAKWIFGGCIFVCAILDFLVPFAARSGIIAMVILRATQGALQGPTLPAVYAMAAKWLPVQEKNRVLARIYVGKNNKQKSLKITPHYFTQFILQGLRWELC
jgi:MFS family permease